MQVMGFASRSLPVTCAKLGSSVGLSDENQKLVARAIPLSQSTTLLGTAAGLAESTRNWK